MRRHRVGPLPVLLITGIGLLAVTFGHAQVPRDRPNAGAGRPGTIRGVVTTTDGEPLRSARVRISPTPREIRSIAETDAEGRYEIAVPTGRYTVTASKSRYVTLAFGQRRVDEGGTVVELSSGQTIEHINIALPPGGVLTGIVSDTYGEVVTGASVQAYRYRYAFGRWQLDRTGRADGTDDRGVYRLFGLPPGDYYVEAANQPLRQKQLAKQDLLIVDELGYVPLSKTGAELLFEIVSQRYEQASTLVTSNLPFNEWTEIFGSDRLTGALLDRLTHHVHILELNGDSYRLAHSKHARHGAAAPAS